VLFFFVGHPVKLAFLLLAAHTCAFPFFCTVVWTVTWLVQTTLCLFMRRFEGRGRRQGQTLLGGLGTWELALAITAHGRIPKFEVGRIRIIERD